MKNNSSKIVSSSEMKNLERETFRNGVTSKLLMEKAGTSVSKRIAEILGHGTILTLIGPGKNGGDGLIAATHLKKLGFRSMAITTSELTGTKLCENAQKSGVDLYELGNYKKQILLIEKLLTESDLILDALYGIGLNKPITPPVSLLIESVNRIKNAHSSKKIVALDIPSGLNPDTGIADKTTIKADITLSLGFTKLGLCSPDGVVFAGRNEIIDIGISTSETKSPISSIISKKLVSSKLPFRTLNSHKGTFGHSLIIGGSKNFTGAVSLAAIGAQRAGSGLTTIATPESIFPIVASHLKEAIYLPLTDNTETEFVSNAITSIQMNIKKYTSVLIGCGLGLSENSRELTKTILLKKNLPEIPLVIDADALNILSENQNWHQKIPKNSILTPHPGEMARLSGKTIKEIELDRVNICKSYATKWNCIVILKGAFTVISSPNGNIWISLFANPNLATAGTGDILAGIITGLLAQKIEPLDAAISGVYLHGLSAEMANPENTSSGIIASDILPYIPIAINQIKKSEFPNG